MRLTIYADGACQGNPGPAGIGVVIKDEHQNELGRISTYIGHSTNNQAEYKAAIAALKAAIKFSPAAITLCLDSQLVVRQLAGSYKVKNASLRPLRAEVLELSRMLRNLSVIHVGREQNCQADSLAAAALKKSVRGETQT